jgi:hypothetical protein
MNLELGNQLQLTDAQQQNDLAKIAASGDQDIRKLVEDANQQRETLAMSHRATTTAPRSPPPSPTSSRRKTRCASALLSNDKIPANERAAYEATISSLGAPIRNYLNSLFTAAPAATGSSYTPQPVGTPEPVTTPSPVGGGLLSGAPPVTDTTGIGGGVSGVGGAGGAASGGSFSGGIMAPEPTFSQVSSPIMGGGEAAVAPPQPIPQFVSPNLGGGGGLLAPAYDPAVEQENFLRQRQQQIDLR